MEFIERYDEGMEHYVCKTSNLYSTVYDEHEEFNRPGIISTDTACKSISQDDRATLRLRDHAEI